MHVFRALKKLVLSLEKLFKYKLIVRISNHVLYFSNVSRLARPNFFSICALKEIKVWPS